MCLHTYLNICLHIPRVEMSMSVHDVLPGGDDGDLSHFLLHLLHSKCVGVYMRWEGDGGALAYTVITVYTNCMINWRLVVGIMRDL